MKGLTFGVGLLKHVLMELRRENSHLFYKEDKEFYMREFSNIPQLYILVQSSAPLNKCQLFIDMRESHRAFIKMNTMS